MTNQKYLLKQREYRKIHRESLLLARRDKYSQNKDAELSRQRKWRLANPDKVAAQLRKGNATRRAAYAEQREAIQSRLRKWRAENPDLVRKYNRRLYAKHRDKILINVKKYQKSNPHIAAQTAHKRRAVIISAPIGELSEIAEWMKLMKSKPDFICQYCKQEFPTSKLQFDHIVPLARGGAHSKDNLCAACKPCNNSKGKKLLSEWKN